MLKTIEDAKMYENEEDDTVEEIILNRTDWQNKITSGKGISKQKVCMCFIKLVAYDVSKAM